MKMLMIIAPPARRDELRELIEKHEVRAYTELGEVTGEGVTGKHFGNHVWPGTSLLLFTVTNDEQNKVLVQAVQTYSKSLYPEEGLKAFVMPVEQVI